LNSAVTPDIANHSSQAPALQAPSLINATATDSGEDDGDALPAVGQVWNNGPKRSLSEIFAAQTAKTTAPPQRPPATPAGIASDLQPIWDALLQRAQQQYGNAVYLPLVASQPRREGDALVIRLTGPFAHVGKMLEKYRDQIQAIASEAAGTPLGIRLELDASSPAATAPPSAAPSTASAAAQRPSSPTVTSPTQQATITAAPARDGIPLTQELRQELEKDPLIRSLLIGFNGTIVKVEQK